MVNCPRCDKWFRDRYALGSHQSRMKPCIEVNKTIKGPEPNNYATHKTNSVDDKENTIMDNVKSAKIEKNNVYNCVYCLSTFKTGWYKKNHEKNCKSKEDPVRIMELEQGIIPEIPENRLECRFCNNIFARTDNLSKHVKICKDRKQYIQELENKKKPQTQTSSTTTTNISTLNNGTINNNCTINNNTINITIGNEDTSHIDFDTLVGILRKSLNECPEDQLREIALKIICSFDKKVKELPENRTIRIPNLNSMIAHVKEEDGWQMVPIDDGIHKVLKNSASGIIKHRTELEAYGKKNRLTFQGTNVPMTPQIMDEVDHIKKNGIYTEQLSGSTKTAIKITNLEN